ncbi:MAG: hypothetical protein ACPGZP_04295 [Panacagrimonas sp.]
MEMIDWILMGVLAAVLTAEMIDAWALHRLTRFCTAVHPSCEQQRRLVRWYAEGFDHSGAVAGWLTFASLLLTALTLVAQAHSMLIAGAAVLALVADGERRLSAELRRRFFRMNPRHG